MFEIEILSESEREWGEIDHDHVRSGLANSILAQWQINRDAKQKVEAEDRASLLAKLGQYDKEVLQKIRAKGGSEVYMRITATKANAALAWYTDIFLHPGQYPHGLESGKFPDMPEMITESARAELERRIAAVQAEGQEITEGHVVEAFYDIYDEQLVKVKKISDAALKREEEKIEDQFREGGFYKALEEALDDFVTYKNMFIEGPFYRKKEQITWVGGQMMVEERVIPTYRRKSPFDVYPSPDAKTINDGNLITIDTYTRESLNSVKWHQDYNHEAVESVLRDFDRLGNWLETDDDEAEIIDPDDHNQRVEVVKAIHIWGNFSGLDLLDWGMDVDCIPDPLDSYQVEAILIGHDVIMCRMDTNKSNTRPIYTASMFPIPGCFWGQSLAERLKDIQDTCNDTARSLINNMLLASGPQIAYWSGLISDDNDDGLYPWKEWEFDIEVTGGQVPIQFFQPSMHAAELMGIYRDFERQADDVSGIPRYAYGSEKVSGAAATASGLSQLLEASGKGIRKGAGYVDRGIIEPAVLNQFNDNMLFEPNPEFYGDVHPVAKGSSIIAMRGAQELRRNEFLAMTNNPVDLSIIGKEGRAELLREHAKGLGWKTADIVPGPEEIQQGEAQQQPNPEALKAELEQKRLEMEFADREKERQSKEKIAMLNYQAALVRAEADLKKVGMTLDKKSEDIVLKAKADEHLMAQQYKAETMGGRGEVVI